MSRELALPRSPFASLVLLALAVGGAPACNSAPVAAETRAEALTPETARYDLPASLPIRNFQPLSEQVAGGGPPDSGTIGQMQARGYSTIINLRTDREPGVAEEAARAAEAGLHYVHIPIDGTRIDLRHALAIRNALDAAPDGKVLLHCGSGSRVGAMWGLIQALESGLSPEEAAAVARRSGMRSTGLEAAVCTSLEDAQIRR